MYGIVALADRARVDLGLSVGISVTVSAPSSNKVCVVVISLKKCILPFSSIPLVNYMSAFCLIRCS